MKFVIFKKLSSIDNLAALVLIKLSAAVADSFITSPSWPVKIIPLFPFIAVASINNMAPPACVQASPIATPGVETLELISGRWRKGPKYACRAFSVIDTDSTLF